MSYGAIYADPPWRFRTWSETNQGRSARAHYDLMETVDIKALPVADMAAKDSCLFLWCINSMLPQAIEVIGAWGFTYKTVAFCWAKRTKHGKPHIGTGYWSRANAELCLLGTRGKPRRQSASVRMLVEAQVLQHSQKPDEIRTRIEQLVPGPYIELFSRRSAPGWDVACSREAGLLDQGPVITRRVPSTFGAAAAPPRTQEPAM